MFHRVFWVSSLFGCFGLCLCFGLFCFINEDTWLFAFHLFSNNVRIVDQRQNVLMTVRASSVHGMSSKKKWPAWAYCPARRSLRSLYSVALFFFFLAKKNGWPAWAYCPIRYLVPNFSLSRHPVTFSLSFHHLLFMLKLSYDPHFSHFSHF